MSKFDKEVVASVIHNELVELTSRVFGKDSAKGTLSSTMFTFAEGLAERIDKTLIMNHNVSKVRSKTK